MENNSELCIKCGGYKNGKPSEDIIGYDCLCHPSLKVIGEEPQRIMDDCLNIVFGGSDKWMTDQRGVKYIREDIALTATNLAYNSLDEENIREAMREILMKHRYESIPDKEDKTEILPYIMIGSFDDVINDIINKLK